MQYFLPHNFVSMDCKAKHFDGHGTWHGCSLNQDCITCRNHDLRPKVNLTCLSELLPAHNFVGFG